MGQSHEPSPRAGGLAGGGGGERQTKPGPTLREMATAVDQLVAAKRQNLHLDEEMTRELGIEPGPDLAFAGVRVMVKRCEAAGAMLRRLASHEAAVMALLAAPVDL